MTGSVFKHDDEANENLLKIWAHYAELCYHFQCNEVYDVHDLMDEFRLAPLAREAKPHFCGRRRKILNTPFSLPGNEDQSSVSRALSSEDINAYGNPPKFTDSYSLDHVVPWSQTRRSLAEEWSKTLGSDL
jgi:hypothetical protein